MDALMAFLPIVLYILGIVLLIVMIILGIKLIETIDRANVVLDDIEKKTKSLNGVFHMIDNTTDVMVGISDTIVSFIASSIEGIINRKREKKDE